MAVAAIRSLAADGGAHAQPVTLNADRARSPASSEAGQAWSHLAAEAVEDNVFFDPLFLTPAAAALGVDPMLITVMGEGGRLDAAMPLRRHRLGRVAPALAGFAHDYGPLGTPLLSRRDPAAAAGRLVEAALARAGSGAALILPYVPDDGPAMAALADAATRLGRQVRRESRHERAMLDRAADGVDPRRTLPTRRRKEYDRQLRRLGDEGATSIETAATPDDVASAFAAFVALEAAGWKGRRRTAFANRPAALAFARQAVVALAAKGACSILTLRSGERAAAMLICFTAGRTATTWKIAYDETLGRFSPGAQLMLAAPPILFANPAVQQIDSCATPNHPMIDHLWRGRLPLATLVIEPARHLLRYRIGHGVARAETGARHWARNLRRGPAARPHHDQG